MLVILDDLSLSPLCKKKSSAVRVPRRVADEGFQGAVFLGAGVLVASSFITRAGLRRAPGLRMAAAGEPIDDRLPSSHSQRWLP